MVLLEAELPDSTQIEVKRPLRALQTEPPDLRLNIGKSEYNMARQIPSAQSIFVHLHKIKKL